MKKKIIVLTGSLGLGGITSFLLPLIKVLAKEQCVTLAYTADPYNRLNELPSNVECVKYSYPSKKKTIMYMLQHGWGWYALKMKFRNHNRVSPMEALQRVNYAEAVITQFPNGLREHYDIAISSAEFYCNNLLVEKISADKRIGWIHPDYKSLNTDVRFDKKTLDKLDIIVTVSRASRESLIEMIPEYGIKVRYIPNLLDKDKIDRLSNGVPLEYKEISKPIFITVARIDNSSKRLDRVVQTCHIMKKSGFSFHWFIVGNGPDYDTVERQIDNMKVSDVLHMLGEKKNPYPYIRYANVFVLTSQYEGRPVVIDEALLLKCPVIVTKYASAEEQIKYTEYIVENDDSKAPEEIAALLMEGKWKEFPWTSECEYQKDAEIELLQLIE